ncbi:MAG: hypothetical protein WBC63_07275, partial [Candidatus Bipolaricaulia bacterium]
AAFSRTDAVDVDCGLVWDTDLNTHYLIHITEEGFFAVHWLRSHRRQSMMRAVSHEQTIHRHTPRVGLSHVAVE